MSLRLRSWLDQLRSRLWFIPGVFLAGAAMAALLLVPLDHAFDSALSGSFGGILFSGGPDSARLVLSTIAAAMLTFTALVYSITILVLQQASSQLSPRVTRTFLRDRLNQSVLGLFIATFLYALLVLREVRSPPTGTSFVPAIAVTVAYLLVVASVSVFIVYIHHMAQAIRASSVLHSLGAETRAAIARLYPQGIGDEPEHPSPTLPDRPPDASVTLRGTAGVITSVDKQAPLHRAEEHRIIIELPHMIGDFVPNGAPLLRVWGTDSRTDDDLPMDALAGAVAIGTERTMTQDAAFGFRQIVDIAERALSPGINDPTTAVQALDELHDLLRRLAARDIPSPIRLAADGSVVLHLPRPSWDDYVALALDEIRRYGLGSLQVERRMRYLLLDLMDAASAFRRPAIDRQLRLLDAGLASEYELREERRSAAQPSASGQGPAQLQPAAD